MSGVHRLWDPALGVRGALRAGLAFAILFGFLITFILLPAKAWPKDPAACDHHWVAGPFYVTACYGYECPRYYPPSALVPLEHCTKCGFVRLPLSLWQEEGETIRLELEEFQNLFDVVEGAGSGERD